MPSHELWLGGGSLSRSLVRVLFCLHAVIEVNNFPFRQRQHSASRSWDQRVRKQTRLKLTVLKDLRRSFACHVYLSDHHLQGRAM